MAFPFQKSLDNGSDKWKVFCKQREALANLSASVKDDSKLFSFEGFAKGKSVHTFLVCGVKDFLDAYAIHDTRHWYEIITTNTPCRLYFDVEFYRAFNPGAEEDIIIQRLVSAVCAQLKSEFDIDVTYDDVVDLESITDSKFSKHLIFHLPHGQLFASNEHVGFFVNKLCTAWKDGLHGNGKDTSITNGGLLVRGMRQRLAPICDQAVYSNNRLFRMFLSSKFGKLAVLKLASSCRFYTSKGIANPPLERIFYDALVCPTQMRSESERSCLSCTRTVKDNPFWKRKKDEGRPSSSHIPMNSWEQCASDDELNVEKFIIQVAGKRLADAKKVWIRSRKQLDGGDRRLMFYGIGGSRYCWNVDREHKSNGVGYVVNLDRMVCYQTCYAPRCTGFRSNEFPINLAAINCGTKRTTHVDDMDSISDESLVKHANEYEDSGITDLLFNPCPPKNPKITPPNEDSLSDESIIRHVTNLEQQKLV